MALDKVESGAIILPPNSTNNLVLGVHAWDFIAVDPADDNVIVEVGSIDGKAEFRVLGSIDEENYPGTGLGPNGEWGVIHGENRLTASAGEIFSDTYIKHPFMIVLADNPTPNPVTVFSIMYGRDSLGDASELPVEVEVVKSADAKTNQLVFSNITPAENGDYLVALAMRDAPTVTSISGLGLTWSLVKRETQAASVATTVWKGTGTATGGPGQNVIVNLNTIKDVVGALLHVKRGGSPLIHSSEKNNGVSTDVQVLNIPTVADSTLFGVIGQKNNVTFTPGAGFVPINEFSRGDRCSIHLVRKSVQAGTEDLTGTLSISKEWAAVGITLKKA